jgi:hypothetical protein
MAANPDLLDEPTFVPDAFRSSHNIKGMLALARRLQTLILMEPGTVPNLVDAGVGIGTYLHEIADENTLESIRSRINRQVETYLPNDSVDAIDVKMSNLGTVKDEYLVIFFRIGKSVDGKDTFALTFSSNNKGSSVKSDFYF